MEFKALIPFAYQDKIFSVGHPKPYEADEKLVKSWEEAGYCSTKDLPKQNNTAETVENVPKEEETSLDKLDYNELKKRAKAAGIPKYNSMKTADLIKALRGE